MLGKEFTQANTLLNSSLKQYALPENLHDAELKAKNVGRQGQGNNQQDNNQKDDEHINCTLPDPLFDIVPFFLR